MCRRRLVRPLLVVMLCAAAGPAWAQQVAVDAIECLPEERNALVRASVDALPPGAHVRLYFRRLHPLGAFYFNRMRPAGDGTYWSVFPRPEARDQSELSDEWWEVLRTRDWMRDRDREWLEEWLADRDREAAEYYATIHDASGTLLVRTPVRVVDVREPEECRPELSPRQRGWAANMTVGETTELQNGNPMFHWLCHGIVTRIRRDGVLQPDEYCRDCVSADSHPHDVAADPDRGAEATAEIDQGGGSAR